MCLSLTPCHSPMEELSRFCSVVFWVCATKIWAKRKKGRERIYGEPSAVALLARPSGGHGCGGGEIALPGRPQAASRAAWESALRGVACALRCAKLRVVRKHFVLPLRGAHLLQLVEGRAAARLLR